MRPAQASSAAEEVELDLLERARVGDVEAFGMLIGRHDRFLRGLAYRLLEDRTRMDDALQEAYVNAFRGLRSFQGTAAFRSWLYRIVYNACMDELRRGRRASFEPLENVAEFPSTAPDPADVAVRRRDLGAALASLPPDQRAAVLLVDAEGLDYATAADVLGVPTGTIGSRLNRARAALRSALGTEGAER